MIVLAHAEGSEHSERVCRPAGITCSPTPMHAALPPSPPADAHQPHWVVHSAASAGGAGAGGGGGIQNL